MVLIDPVPWVSHGPTMRTNARESTMLLHLAQYMIQRDQAQARESERMAQRVYVALMAAPVTIGQPRQTLVVLNPSDNFGE